MPLPAAELQQHNKARENPIAPRVEPSAKPRVVLEKPHIISPDEANLPPLHIPPMFIPTLKGW
eukprot:13859333-Ditylum_brightwellii.AAC.1